MTNAKPTIDLKKILAGAQLAALPQSAIRLLELSQDPDNGPAEFAVPIESDPGLTGQVLKFVNSSYFGFSREISSVKLAITLVGIRTIKNFALWSAVFSLMPNPKCGPFDLKSLWQDSLRRGLFARAVGKVMALGDAEDLFAAALLQDMAIPLLAKELPQQYSKLLENRQDGEHRLSQLEQEVFGWSHADAASVMAESWSLPEYFASLIKTHAQFATLAECDSAQPSQIAVALSSHLPSTQDPLWHDREVFEAGYQRIRRHGSPELASLLRIVDDQFGEFAPVLKLAVPAKSLASTYAQSAQIIV